MKVLIIEDELKLSNQLKKGLEENQHRVDQAFDGIQGLKQSRQTDYDLIILDIIMPELSGLDVCKKIREDKSNHQPLILMLTALGTTEDVVDGLNAGADDYLPKPFRFKELLARINALSRRGKISETRERILSAADLELDTFSKEVSRGGRHIELTALEFKLLEYLLKNKNRVVSRMDILERVWEDNMQLTTNIVEVYISYLRNKVDRDQPVKLIKTVKGMGYAIKES